VPEEAEEQPPKRRKSVRFSTTVESTTFLHCDPPSPDRSVIVAKCNGVATIEDVSTPTEAIRVPVEASAPGEKQNDKVSAPPASSRTDHSSNVVSIIENKEHLQLSAEEAFFLAYGIGALSILDPDTKTAIPREKLLSLFRSHSYFPPRQELQPSDPFLVHYVVYHHFRSLGWVPRHGIKFGVDWMLYTRGPVFDHAEFGLTVMPSYSHSWWKENGGVAHRKSWHWLHGVNRVLSHVLKSLVLVYVDVPPPHIFEAAMAAGGISAALKEYKVREFMVRRWSSNRNR
jgi:tRNA-splicing endonuclease subunit Sen2